MNAAVEATYTAKDKNAYRGSRTHELILSNGNIEKITFPNETAAVPVSTEVALKLSRIDGFEVKDTKGLIVIPQQVEEETSLGEVISLASDQVIANLSELTKEALILRANEVGGTFKGNTPKETLIQFLVDYNVANPSSAESGMDFDDEIDIEEEGGV